MGVTIEDEGSPEPKWSRLEKIDLREVTKTMNADPNLGNGSNYWVKETHRRPFERPAELPLWRIVVAVQEGWLSAKATGDHPLSFTVGFFAHHAIADGISAGVFHLTFLNSLNGIIGGKVSILPDANQAAIIAVPKLPLIPNLEKLHFPSQ